MKNRTKTHVPSSSTRGLLIHLSIIAVIMGLFVSTTINANPVVETLEMSTAFSFDTLVYDWELQDDIESKGYAVVCGEILESTPNIPTSLQEQASTQISDGASDSQMRATYTALCAYRRIAALQPFSESIRKVVFVKRGPDRRKRYPTFCLKEQPGRMMDGGMHIVQLGEHTECMLETIHQPDGVVRDPEVSYDGKKLLFAHAPTTKHMDYFSIYEMDLETRDIRRITSDFNDLNAIYLPNDQILFSSTRCFARVPCNGSPVINFFLCDRNGDYIRQIGFDQAHTWTPAVMPDGTILYTRWGYNDRGRWHTFDLFTMNPDGTNQKGYYGNNSCYPPLIACARPIPGSSEVVAILSGKNDDALRGPMVKIDIRKGRDGLDGLEFVAAGDFDPEIECGQKYKPHIPMVFTYPYPLNDTTFLVSASTQYSSKYPFAVYLQFSSGRRELLAHDETYNCLQAIPVAPRPEMPSLPEKVDYTKSDATCSVLDIHIGDGLAGVPRGTVKKLRVVALDYRIDEPAHTGCCGTTFHPPASLKGGSWDVKHVLGDIPVAGDGSANMILPARVPLYFQALDSLNQVVQSMREWTVFQPGESGSCIGCHEDKDITAPPKVPEASTPRDLEPFYGPTRGFSFIEEIQPILDNHCTKCHNGLPYEGKDIPKLTSDSLESGPRYWSVSYINLLGGVPNCNDGKESSAMFCREGAPWQRPFLNYYGYDDQIPVLPPYSRGASQSTFMSMLRDGHNQVSLSREELDKIACWIDLAVPFAGSWVENMSERHAQRYNSELGRQAAWLETERNNIEAYAGGPVSAGNALDRSPARQFSQPSVAPTALRRQRFIPTDGIISLPSRTSPANLCVYNALGQPVYRVRVSGERQRVYVPRLPQGLYLVETRPIR